MQSDGLFLYFGTQYGDLIKRDLEAFAGSTNLVQARTLAEARRNLRLYRFDAVIIDESLFLQDDGACIDSLRRFSNENARVPIRVIALQWNERAHVCAGSLDDVEVIPQMVEDETGPFLLGRILAGRNRGN